MFPGLVTIFVEADTSMAPRLARTLVLVVVSGVLMALGCTRAVSPGTSPNPPSASTPSSEASATNVASSLEGPQPKPTPAPATPTSTLSLTPTVASLEPGDLGLQMLVEGPSTHGGRRDLTGQVRWEAEPEGIVAIEPGGYLRPLAAGNVAVHAVIGDVVSAPTAVTVARQTDRAWNFGEDVVPLFTRLGCNSGGCHGRADGQNGFHLSLFGYDAEGDHRTLTREAGGRRLSVFDPDNSLLLRKATGRVAHGGGQRLLANTDEYRALRDWIAAGAPLSRGKTHGSLVSVDVEPTDVRLDEPGPQQLRVVARYADGHARDVTRLASYRVNDESTASIDVQGKAALLRRAETDLVVRYRSSVMSTRLATLINPDLSFDFAALPRRNLVDDELFKRLESLRVPPSPPASDAAFLRRTSLDLTGEQPDPDQIRRFIADTDPDKRSKLIDSLLASPNFVLFWEIKLGDLLAITPARFGNGAYYYEAWLGSKLKENAPWDEIVRALLTSVGDPMAKYTGGPVNYALDAPDPKARAELTAQRFLGLRIRCAQCHDHPFDVWTQDDYFGFAAIFAKVEASGPGPGQMQMRTIVKVNPEGKVEHLRTKKPAKPRLLNGEPVNVEPSEDPRTALADWMTSPDNPYFARAMANWVWAQFFGKGLADPADDLSRSNPPVHPELLDALASHFVGSKYDLRDLIRSIATSEAYGLSSATVPENEHDTRMFSHHMARPLTAHQMADALAQATAVENRYPNRGPGTRAIEVNDPTTRSTILDTFGRCARTNGCASVTTPELSLRQALLLIGGDVIEGKIASLNGYLSNLLELNPEADEIVENLYLRTVCRPPTADEVAYWAGELKSSSSQRESAEDLFWALLNSREFAFNH
jgi:Protein of unknown function (DUF1549)/Protein of unknown function (DUF1553)